MPIGIQESPMRTKVKHFLTKWDEQHLASLCDHNHIIKSSTFQYTIPVQFSLHKLHIKHTTNISLKLP